MSVPLFPFSEWMDNVALAALSSKETLYATYDLARNCIERGIPGDFVECGVFGGAQCAVMARAIMNTWDWIRYTGPLITDIEPIGSRERRVHLFDTFAGIPQAGPHDKEFLAENHEAGLSACPAEEVQRHMEEWSLPAELFIYHEGLFRETTVQRDVGYCDVHSCFEVKPFEGSRTCQCPKCGRMCPVGDGDRPIKAISLLRIDGDLYESTKDVMDNLYPLVSPGGWVICDDFALSGARKAVCEHFGGSMAAPVYWRK